MPSGVRGNTGDWKKNGQKKNKCTLKKDYELQTNKVLL
tara:strand:- start:745 stop:858 length:114 start_codon:yes stop_codon:yes gene_type:complete